MNVHDDVSFDAVAARVTVATATAATGSSCMRINSKLIDWLDLLRINDRCGAGDRAERSPKRHNNRRPKSSRTSASDPVPGSTSPVQISLATRGPMQWMITAQWQSAFCSVRRHQTAGWCCCCCSSSAYDKRSDMYVGLPAAPVSTSLLSRISHPHRFCLGVYRVFQKSSSLKLFGIFSLRLTLFAWNFANLLAIHIQIYLPFL